MKVQCSCGAKCVFEITDEMRSHPVRFACPTCGQDASEFVDGLIRQELGQSTTPTGRVINTQPIPEDPANIPNAGPLSGVRLPSAQPSTQPSNPAQVKIKLPNSATPVPLRIQGKTEESVSQVAGTSESADSSSSSRCLKHPGEIALEKCYVCSKPICPRCMELFGHVCSPLCNARAASHGIQVPVYKYQKSLVEQRLWRKTVWVGGIVGTVAVAVLGFWIWHQWIGVLPKEILSIRFAAPAYSGQTAFASPDQLVFMHGGTLVRHDMLQKKQIWSQYLIDKNEIKLEVARETEQARKLINKANDEAWENMPRMPDPEKLSQSLERDAAASLGLWVRGRNIWVLSSEKLTRYDWDTGKLVQDIKLPGSNGGLICRDDELLTLNSETGRPTITSVNLTSCDSRTTELAEQSAAVNQAKTGMKAGSPSQAGAKTSKAGLPTGMPGRDAGKVMDPAKVAAQAQHLSLPARIALPAILANSWNQERTLAQLDENPRSKAQTPAAAAPLEHFTLMPTKDGYLELSSRLLERKTISHSTLSASPAKSVLDGPVNVTQSSEVANEILNEMQRERGGGVVEEDVSRYSVTLRRSGSPDAWTGEVVGEPVLFPLQTVNVLTANKTAIVFDKTNKKVWQATLNFNLSGDPHLNGSYGHGPCVEQKDSLYIFDAGVLTAFDLKTGNARWRLPSIGISGLFFDDEGMLYVNTTTGSPDQIKLSHQININQKTLSAVLKVAPANGKILWTAQPGGLVNYVSGKFVYTVQSYAPEEEEDNPYKQETGFETLPHMRIKRLNPRNGHTMWEHFQQRAPLDVQFDKNYIRLVFKKEIQVLKCMTW